ncbi:MAG: class I SAM-dependent DNA methyltransferase [Chloroflexota bacterium]
MTHSSGVFGRDYAAAYDDLYQDKNYLAECELIERVFKTYAQGAIRRVLDLGCGTGGHSAILSKRGFAVVGVDRSTEVLERARGQGTSARFDLGDIAGLDLGETFDAVLMMFAVLGYQVGNAHVQAALATARRHLRPGGLFTCDFWYGPAVLSQGPSERVKVLDSPHGQLIRVATGELDVLRNVCTVGYHVWRIERSRVVAEVREQHPMRYFFALEIELLLAAAGFELIRLGAFPNLDDEPSEQTWNVALVARAV